MKILHCAEYYYPHLGGVERHVQVLSEFFKKKLNDVHVATSTEELRESKKINDIKIIEFNIKGNFTRGYKGNVDEYYKFLVKSKYDIILFYAAQQWTTDLALDIIEKIKGKKIFIPCGFSRINNFLYKPYYNLLKKKINNFDEIICFSKNYQDYKYCSENFYKKIHIIQNGAFEEFAPKNQFINKFQEKKSNITILSVSNFKFNKGQDRALTIVSNLKFKKYSLFFICYNLKKNFYYFFLKIKIILILLKNPHCEIKILNNVSDSYKKSAFAACDYFIHPSRIECSPLVLFETLAAGKIYLGTNVGCVKEIIKKVKIGFCSNSIMKISNKLDFFINHNYHTFDRYRKKILSVFRRNYNWNFLLKKYEKIYLKK